MKKCANKIKNIFFHRTGPKHKFKFRNFTVQRKKIFLKRRKNVLCLFSLHKITVFSLAFCLAAVAIISVIILRKNSTEAASNAWVQTDWTGGTDAVNFPDHTNNKTGWTKYYSDTSIDNSGGELKLGRYSN